MKIRFGPNVYGEKYGKNSLYENLKKAYDFSDEVIELCLVSSQQVFWDKKALELFKQFKYKSIHLPAVERKNETKVFLKYPNKRYESFLEIIDKIIKFSKPDTVLVHPDVVSDFNYFNLRYGSLLAYENMDNRKEFGKTVEDMENVFAQSPQAKWVFDVNHVYTVDPTMKLADDFFNKFKDRLIHYHLSGYGGFHNPLCLTREDIILKGIKSIDFPIVDEGQTIQKNVLSEEYDYIVKRL